LIRRAVWAHDRQMHGVRDRAALTKMPFATGGLASVVNLQQDRTRNVVRKVREVQDQQQRQQLGYLSHV
jgi:hypothetical protein